MEIRPPAVASPRVDWRAVAVFYFLACSISWPTFWWRDRHPDLWAAWQAPGYVKGLLPCLGPAVGAFASLAIFRRVHRRVITPLGTSPWRSILFAFAPMILLAVYGIGDDEPHLTGLLWAGVLAAYALGEEFGWRGYLQDALRPLAPGPRFALIGGLWGLWHFTTFVHGTPVETLVRLGLMTTLWIGGSWGLGALADRTGSVTVAAAVHLVFNYFSLLPPRLCLAVLAPSIVVWALLLRRWPPNPALQPLSADDEVGVR